MKRSALLLAAVLMCVGGRALAQDEMPPTPKSAAPALPPAGKTPPGAAPAPAGEGAQKAPPGDEGPLPPGTMIDQPIAILQALDKISARVRRLPVKVGQTAPFGTLTIEVDACRKAPPEDPPQSAAFLKITDTKPGETPRQVFSGWMFASSPALSAMDHPVYDIWVVDCSSEPTASAAPSQ